jgi:Domain of unknown function (DUF3854)/Family of unknown function (DUF5906)
MTPKELTVALVAKLTASGLTASDAKLLGYAARSGAEAKAAGLAYPCAGFKLPYFTLAGKETAFFRFRYLEDTRTGFAKVSGAKPVRYVQPKASLPAVYIPPLIKWPAYLADTANRLVFTEGELKAAAATARGVPTLGLGGVWSFKSTKAKLDILPIFKDLNLSGRECVICFDSDAASNPDIRRAEVYFAEELGKLGAHVAIARLPVNGAGAKVGMDDYLVAEGAEALVAVIDAAEPYEATAKLHAMNTEVAVVSRPGFIIRLEDKFSMSVSDFTRLHYAARQHRDYTNPEKPKLVQTAEVWLKWPQRAVVAALTYAPGQAETTPSGELNTWGGWGVEPCAGSVAPWTKLLDFLLPEDGSGARRWFEQWCAWPLQHPGFKLRSAVLLWGRQQGTGKSLVGYTLGKVYGKNFAEIDDAALDPARTFNGWARDKQFALADDVTGNDSRRLANKIKVMISRERIEINEKNIREYTIPDCINYLFTANDPDAFYLDDNDRRMLIHEVTGKPLTADFYTKVYDPWYKSVAGAGALFQHLLALDTSDFNPMGPPPVTSAKLEMAALGKTALEQWVAALIADPDDYLKGLKGELFTPEELCALYDPNDSKREVSPVLMARKLAVYGALRVAPKDSKNGQIRSAVKNKLIRVYALRNPSSWVKCTSADARAHYDSFRTSKISKFKGATT